MPYLASQSSKFPSSPQLTLPGLATTCSKNMHGTENDTKNPFDLALLLLNNLSEFIR